MKSRKKTKNMVIAGFCIVLALSINICDQSKFNTEFCKDSRNNIKFTYSKLKLSKIVGTIHINNNWSEAKTAGLVTGSGTFSDPYVIEDLVIDGNFSGFCIWIENSSSYVRIENCTLYNSGSFSDKSWYWMDNIEYWWLGGGGIVLSNVSNSLVIGNNVSNNYRGILLKDSSNNTLSGNSVNNNDSYGIDLILSGNNTLSGNILNNHGLLIFGSQEQLSTLKITTNNLVNGKFIYYYVNEIDLKPYNFSNAGQVYLVNCSNSNISNLNVSSSTIGITLFYSNNNTISGSTSNNNFLGIGLINSSYNNITKNIANYNTMTGIALISSNNNSISGNTANNNSWIGINLVESNFNSIFGNIANNNTQNGLASTDSDNNKISGNIISYNGGNGLFFISNFDKNTITGNNVSHNEGHGLWLSSECNNNNISDNNIRSNEGNGIGFQINCSYNSISRNVISNNEGHGIQISDECNYNSISENIATGNHETGIYLVYSENNKILGNTANDNYRNIYEYWVHGIHLFQSDNNTLLENTVNNNTNGIFLEYSKHNDIAGNTARYNKLNHFEFGNGIFFLSSGNNNISGNILNNNVGGINIERCSNNSFINNTANYNSYFGIGGSNSNFNIISDNNIKYNALVGIGFIDCYYNNISRNFVDNHSLVGIGFIESHFNSIFDNIITNNLWGIYLNQSCRNDVYGNIFMNNTNGDFFEEPGDNCPPKGLIPVAFFTATPTIISLSNSIVQFQFRGYEGDGPTTFQWNFGDDTANSTEKNPTHRYTSPGIYTVILTVIDSDGDSDVLKRLNYIIVREETIIPGFDVFFLLSILSLITVTIGKNFKKIKPQFKISQKINTDFLRSKLNWKIYGVQQFVRRVQNIVL